MTRGPQNLSEEIEICDADGTNAHRFPLSRDRYDTLLWDQGSVPAEDAEPGAELTKTWDYFGGGSGETYDLEELLQVKTGGYYFSVDCQVCNPYAIRPRQTVTTVTLTNNNTEATQMFEAKSASQIKYLYALTDTKAHKVTVTGTPALKNTKDFSTPNVEFATGSYTCTTDAIAIYPGFAPKAIIIKAVDGAYAAAFKTTDMSSGAFKEATGTFYESGGLSTGVTITGATVAVGASAPTSVFHAGTTYSWMAFAGDYVKVDTYTGDGTDARDITVETSWGQPDAVFVMTDNDSDEVVFRNGNYTGDGATVLSADSSLVPDTVQATADWPVDGFEIGTLNGVNRSGATVYYVALKGDTNVLEFGNYAGDGNDDRSISSLGFNPTYVLISTSTVGYKSVHRSDYNSGDSSMYFSATVNAANQIQDLETPSDDGFQIGSANNVNIAAGTPTYYWMAARTDPAGAVICGQPAEWNEIWELPKGPDVDRAGLTAIVDGTGDDTWTARSTGSPKASHLCVVENELVRASADRMIDKCSALDTDVDANWTGDYYVGQPGTKITKLVNAGGEVGVGTTDGFYLFDMISQSRQMLPLLGGITDDDNAKGAMAVVGLTLVPTVAGAYRILGGSGVPFGPDTRKLYTEVEGPSSIPIKLKHYGFAFLGTYVYEAVYDGTNYHIIYTQLTPDNPTLSKAIWDFLLTTTNKIKILFVDSECRLWFPYANNLAYITLSGDGAPDGGSWGETSGSGGLYHPVTRMGTNALKRFRLVEIEVDSMPANFSWACYVYRDGGSAESVGSTITSDGVGECFWTAGTNDTGREIQLLTRWAGTSGYSVQSTPPEVKRITLHAEPLTEDADLIVCSIDLSENAKERKAIIDSKLNSAPIKLIDPLTGEKHTVVLYRRRVYQLRQAGTDPPKAACELRFRRSDIA